jgi:FemAB-related protein (PEP-CTERM system-associated)
MRSETSVDLDYSVRTRAVDSPGPVEIHALQPGGEDEWDRFVTSALSGTYFHLSGWKTVIESVLRRRCFYLLARRERNIVGVFPLTWVRSGLFGDCLVSSPLGVYGGICADEEDAYFALLKAGADLASRLGVKYLEMRNRIDRFPTSLPGRDLYVTFTQDLSPGPDKLMKALPRDTRYMIRKSQKAALEWTEDLTLSEFYDLYAKNVHRLGTPVFSRELFKRLRSVFPKQCRLFGVRKGKKAIAGVLCFYFRKEVIPYYSGSLAEYHNDCPNNFMYWSLMEQSWQEGCCSFDFGRSKRGTGACKFKSSWNMQVTELPYRYKLIRTKEVPHMSPVDGKFRLAVSLWKRLPLRLTKILGPPLVRRIPSI